jgi:hypothetical protein
MTTIEAELTKFGDIKVRVHPAAKLFPMMTDAALDELAADIAELGLQQPLVWIATGQDSESELLDGRNRVAAIARIPDKKRRETLAADIKLGRDSVLYDGKDPYAYVISANLHRRHLTGRQKRGIIAALLKDKPERSDLATSKIADVSDKTVTSVRRDLEGRAEIPNVSTKTDGAGRRVPAKKSVPSLRSRIEALRTGSSEHAAAQRRSEVPNAEPAPAPTTVPSGASDSLETYLALLPDDQTLVRQIWSAAQREATITPGPPGKQRELSLTELITAALDRISELTEELEAAGPDALEPEILVALRERTDTGMGALRDVLGALRKLPPADAAIADRVMTALRAAGASGLAKNEIFAKKVAARDRDEILLHLRRQGEITKKPPAADGRRGRPAERYIVTGAAE